MSNTEILQGTDAENYRVLTYSSEKICFQESLNNRIIRIKSGVRI